MLLIYLCMAKFGYILMCFIRKQIQKPLIKLVIKVVGSGATWGN